MRLVTLPIAGLALWCVVSSTSAAPRTIAVFDFELIDSSLEGSVNGPRADEQTRLADVGNRLRQRLAESGKFMLVDMAPVGAEAHANNLQACGGCDTRLARQVGAELALTGTVQKVSNLILNMNLYVRDAGSGQVVAAASADLRGNTEESWSRALDWLVRNRLLADGALE
jgi:chitinase